MQTTSQTWRDLWASGVAVLEAKAVINGTDYTEISDPIINRALMQGGLSIGNAVSATCSFSVRTSATIPKSAEVVIKMRLTDGTTASEWLNAGTFYISHRQRDPVTGVLTLECYDAMLKANAQMPRLMPWTTAGGQVMTTAGGEWLYLSANYPRSMAALVKDLALLLGATIDPETEIATGAEYVITADDVGAGTTINQVLSKIAAANGGNWIMTPDNTLRLVPVISAEGAASASEDLAVVSGIIGGINTSNTGTITGIRYKVNATDYVVGDETGIVIEADVTAAVAADLASKLVGMTYQAYELKGAIYDPAATLGDYVRAGANGEVRAVLCAEVATLGLAFRGDISAPEIGELADEYPYENFNGGSVELEAAKAYTNSKIIELDNSLSQQEIFDRLTNDGQAQGIALVPVTNPGPSADTPKMIVLNLNYARLGVLTANQVNLGDYTSPISVPDENDPSTLLEGQTLDAGGWITGGPYAGGAVTVCEIDDATPYRGQTITITATTKAEIEGGENRVVIDSTQEVETWIAPASGAFDSEGNLIGSTNMGAAYKYTRDYTIPDDADSVYIIFDCEGVKNVMVDFKTAQSKEFRYESNIGIGYKGLQVGAFVVDRSGNVNINGGMNVGGAAGASGSFTVGGVTVTVTNGIITNIT